MNVKRTVGMVVALAVAIIIVSSIMVPVISTAREEVVIVDQEGAGWLRMTYQDSGDYSVAYSVSGDTVTIGTQSGSADDMIVYVDSINTTVLLDGKFYNTDSTGTRALADSFTISRLDGNVTIDGESAGSPTYAYVPAAQGTYGFFDGSVPAMMGDSPLISFGSFAGLTVSDKYTPYGLVMNSEYDGDYLESTTWAVGSSSGQQVTEPIGVHESALMLYSVPPTPSYTDGDWGYNINSNGVTATVVSYSGPSGTNVDIVMPDMVGGYTVSQVGGGSVAIFDTSKTFGSLTLPSEVKYIGAYAFSGCSGFTGTLTIPSGVISINQRAFNGCSGFTGTLTIPSSVTNIYTSAFSGCSGFTGTLTMPSGLNLTGEYAFENCTGLTGLDLGSVKTISQGSFKGCTGLTNLTIPASVTSINNNAFYGCSGLTGLVVLSDCVPYNTTVFQGTTNLKEVLNLGTATYTTTSYGLNANEVRSDIPGSGFLAPTEFREESQKSGPVWSMLSVIPLITILGIIVAAVAFMRRS